MALTAVVEGSSPVTEAAILNGICCPPQDPFKLLAQELLLKPQRREVMKRDRDQRSEKKFSEETLAIVLCRGF